MLDLIKVRIYDKRDNMCPELPFTAKDNVGFFTVVENATTGLPINGVVRITSCPEFNDKLVELTLLVKLVSNESDDLEGKSPSDDE